MINTVKDLKKALETDWAIVGRVNARKLDKPRLLKVNKHGDYLDPHAKDDDVIKYVII